MPRICTICTHADRATLDAALVEGTAETQIAALFRVSPDAVARHKANHLPALLVKARAATEIANADDLLAAVRDLQQRALTILDTAESSKDFKTALQAIREARACLELLAKLMGELDDRPTVNLLIAPEWLAVRGALLAALLPYPDARAAVAAHLSTLDAETNGHRG